MAATDALPQHLSALERANAIRLRRAEVKRDVRAGRKTIRDVLEVHDVAGVETLEDVEPAIAGLTIGDLLTLPHRWGRLRARKLLEDLRVAEGTRLDALTARRRRMIVAAFEGNLEARQEDARRRALAEQRAAEERARRARARAEREEAEEQARRARVAAAFDAMRAAQRTPRDPLELECPDCRSAPGDVCSTYDPVRDRWTEHPESCAARRRAAA